MASVPCVLEKALDGLSWPPVSSFYRKIRPKLQTITLETALEWSLCVNRSMCNCEICSLWTHIQWDYFPLTLAFSHLSLHCVAQRLPASCSSKLANSLP